MRIEAKYQIERVTSADPAREYMTHSYYEPERKRLLATDGHMAVIVPVAADDGDTEGYVSDEALQAARKTAAKNRTDVLLLVNGAQVVPGGPTFPRPDATQWTFPPVDAAIPKIKPGDAGTITIGLNVHLLLDLAKAVGAGGNNDGIVSITFEVPEVQDVPATADRSGTTFEHPSRQVFARFLNPLIVQGRDPAAIGCLMPAKV